MRKIFTLIIACIAFVCDSSAQSDSFKSFRVDFGLLLAMPSGNLLTDDGNGLGLYLNPKIHITDNILLGAKLEGALIGSDDDLSPHIPHLFSYAATFDYYFNSNTPFVGIDAGLYDLGVIDLDGPGFSTDEDKVDLGSKFGIAPKIGFSYGHFDFAFQYNLIFGQRDGYDESNYTSIKVGFHFGGGKK